MTNRFENKSKLTLFFVLALSLVLLLVVFEKLVGITLGHSESETRHIRLRENAPLLNLKLTPSATELKFSENLENKAYSFATDENGFLLPSLVHDNAEITLAFIGGSTTENMYVDAEKRFPHLTSELLSNDKRKVNSINAGVSGNNSLNSINTYLNKVIPIKPDIAFLMHNINDISTLLHEGSYWNNNYYRSPIIHEDKSLKSFAKSTFPNSFELLHRVKSSLKDPVDEFANDRGKRKVIDKQNIYRLFEENLEMFISISKAKGIKPILMTQANRFTANPDQVVVDRFKDLESLGIEYNQFKQLFDGMNNRIRMIAKKHNITLIDLDKLIPANKEYIVDTVHFNNQGSEQVAKLITKQLQTVVDELINAKKK